MFKQAKKPAKLDAKIEIKTEDEETNDVADSGNAKRKPKVMTEEKQKMLHTEKVNGPTRLIIIEFYMNIF